MFLSSYFSPTLFPHSERSLKYAASELQIQDLSLIWNNKKRRKTYMQPFTQVDESFSILTTTSARLQKKTGLFRLSAQEGSRWLSCLLHWTCEDPAFKRLAAFIDREQTSDQVICQQNTSNYIKTLACLPAKYWWTCLFATVKLFAVDLWEVKVVTFAEIHYVCCHLEGSSLYSFFFFLTPVDNQW